MRILLAIFGEGSDLSVWQMSSRAFVVFFFALLLIRIAGRRSFGLRAPFDNIILILLGAILSQAVIGRSLFFPTLAAGLTISILHRLLAVISLISPFVGKITKGNKISLYENGALIKPHLKRCLVSEEDIMEEVRLRAETDSLENVEAVYMERNGRISAIKKCS